MENPSAVPSVITAIDAMIAKPFVINILCPS